MTNPRLIPVRKVAEYYGCSVSSVWRDRTIPKPVRNTGRTRWVESEIIEDIKAKMDAR